jgi:hypothetical protein
MRSCDGGELILLDSTLVVPRMATFASLPLVDQAVGQTLLSPGVVLRQVPGHESIGPTVNGDARSSEKLGASEGLSQPEPIVPRQKVV